MIPGFESSSATHHQGFVRYRMSRGIQCSCMSLMLVCWTLFKSAGIWGSFGLDYILQNSSINVEFLNNRIGEITAGAYLLSITEIVSDCQQIGTEALLIINNYILGLVLRNQCFFLFDSHSKDGIRKMSATGTTGLLKFDSLQSLGN